MSKKDASIVPYGMYKGWEWADVPESYLYFLCERSCILTHLGGLAQREIDIRAGFITTQEKSLTL